MKHQKEKQPVKSSIGFSDFHLYRAPEGDGQRLKKFSHQEKSFLYPRTTKSISDFNASKQDQYSEPSPELLDCYDEALDFVENLTGFDLSPIQFYQSSEETDLTFSFSALQGIIASHLDITTYKFASDGLRHNAITSLLVHELMHATGSNTASLFGVAKVGGFNKHVFSGYTMIDARSPKGKGQEIQNTIGCFFEEAIAEEAAALWREHVDPTTQKDADKIVDLSAVSNGPSLSYRYVDIEGAVYQARPSSISFTASAYCAEGLRQIGMYTGVDMFPVMLATRHPEQQAEARRRIIQAIEQVKPGLYPVLRDLPYGQDSFIAGCQMITEAIEQSKQKREHIGALALSA